jgi:excisionase family DNA binding protein
MADSDLLTVTQAAEALSSSGQSIRNWIREGRLAAVRVGNRFLIARAEIERMRGEAPGPGGEGPWEFADDAPRAALRRAVGASRAERLLGD